MRKVFTPQNETHEIADSDLDQVSGGILEAGNLLSGATSALPALSGLALPSGSVAGDLGAQIGPVAAQAGFAGGA